MSCTLAAGLSLRWMRDELYTLEKDIEAQKGNDVYNLMTANADTVPVGSDGLIYLPYLMGERSPVLDPNARGVFFGLTARHTKSHMTRAVLEGITLSQRHNLEVLHAMDIDPKTLTACGGGAQSPFWRQLLADVLKCSIVTTTSKEGPALGAAILAGVAAGIFSSVEEGCEKLVKRSDKRSDTNSDAASKYDEIYKLYSFLYPTMRPAFAKLDTLRQKLDGDKVAKYKDVTDIEFERYGKVISDIPTDKILSLLEKTPLTDGTDYKPSVEVLEEPSLVKILHTNLPTIIQTIIAVLPQIITSVIQTLLTHLPEIIDAGFKLLTALIDNLPEIILTIVEALPEIISAIVKALTDNIPLIVETGVKLLTSLITNLPQIIAEIVRAMPEIITGIVNALSEGISQVTEVGANLVRGLWNGIQSLAGWLWDQVSSWISGIWDGIKDFFGIASPSKQMAWVGSMLVEGLAGAIDKDGEKAVAAVDDMAAGMIAEVESEMAKVNASLADGIGDIETGFTARATIQEVTASIPSSLNAGRMGAGATAGGETTVTNHFHIAALQVREEADVKKVAKELYNMQKTKTRSKGVVT